MSLILGQILTLGFARAGDTLRNYELEEVVISATRMNTQLKNIPQKVEIISKEEILTVPSDNLAELLKRKTNLDIVQYPGMSSSIGMRGFSPTAHSRSYTLLLINGKPSGTTNMASMDTENIERIEIIKGPYSVLYGSDAMGGIINIITERSAGTEGGSISIGAGSFGSFKYSGDLAGALGKNSAFNLGFSRKQQNRDYRIGSKNLMKMVHQ